MPKVSLEAVLSALRAVPGATHNNMIQDLRVSDEGVVSFRLASPSIHDDLRRALSQVAGVTGVEIQLPGSRAEAAASAMARDSAASAARDSAASTAPASAASTARGAPGVAGVRHIIAVSSGKGGVGKSTVAVNLATALALGGARVGLLDADVYGPNVPTMMGVTDSPEIVPHPTDARQGEVFVPPVAHGVRIMSMGFLIRDDQPAIWRGPMLHSVVSQFFNKVIWGELEYLVIDMPPGTGDVQLSVAQLAPISGAVLVTTPQEVSMQDVRKAFHMFEKVRVPVLGFVENMSWFKCDGCEKRHSLFGKDGGRTLARKFGAELLAQLPIQPDVREGGDEGTPVVVRAPQSEVALALRELARKVAGEADRVHGGGATPEVRIGKFD